MTPRYLSDSYDSADQTKYSVLLNWYPVIDKSIINPTGSKNSSFLKISRFSEEEQRLKLEKLTFIFF